MGTHTLSLSLALQRPLVEHMRRVRAVVRGLSVRYCTVWSLRWAGSLHTMLLYLHPEALRVGSPARRAVCVGDGATRALLPDAMSPAWRVVTVVGDWVHWSQACRVLACCSSTVKTHPPAILYHNRFVHRNRNRSSLGLTNSPQTATSPAPRSKGRSRRRPGRASPSPNALLALASRCACVAPRAGELVRGSHYKRSRAGQDKTGRDMREAAGGRAGVCLAL